MPKWSWVVRVIALPMRKRPLPQPRSTTTGASRPKSSRQSSVPSAGIALSAVCVHFPGGTTVPGNATPNSRSVGGVGEWCWPRRLGSGGGFGIGPVYGAAGLTVTVRSVVSGLGSPSCVSAKRNTAPPGVLAA